MEKLKGMSEKESFDAQMRLAEYHISSVTARMGNGWKVSLGLWSFLGLLAGALITKQVSIGDDDLAWVRSGWLFVLPAVVFLAYLLFIVVIAKDNRKGSEKIVEILRQVAGGKEVPAPTDGKKPGLLDRVKRFLFVYYSQIFQVVITTVLMIFVVGAFYIATPRQGKPTSNTKCICLKTKRASFYGKCRSYKAKCAINNGENKWQNKH